MLKAGREGDIAALIGRYLGTISLIHSSLRPLRTRNRVNQVESGLIPSVPTKYGKHRTALPPDKDLSTFKPKRRKPPASPQKNCLQAILLVQLVLDGISSLVQPATSPRGLGYFSGIVRASDRKLRATRVDSKVLTSMAWNSACCFWVCKGSGGDGDGFVR